MILYSLIQKPQAIEQNQPGKDIPNEAKQLFNGKVGEVPKTGAPH